MKCTLNLSLFSIVLLEFFDTWKKSIKNKNNLSIYKFKHKIDFEINLKRDIVEQRDMLNSKLNLCKSRVSKDGTKNRGM